MTGDRNAGESVIGFNFTKNKFLLLFAAISVDLPVKQRNGDSRRMYARAYLSNLHWLSSGYPIRIPQLRDRVFSRFPAISPFLRERGRPLSVLPAHSCGHAEPRQCADVPDLTKLLR